MAKKFNIPVAFPPPVLALSQADAATALGVHRCTVYRLVQLRKLRKTSYGRIPVAEIERHLREEVAR